MDTFNASSPQERETIVIKDGKATRVLYDSVFPAPPCPLCGGAERPASLEEFCLGCNKPTAKRDCGCPAGSGWREPVNR
jgi:hypothetical protein